MWTHTKHSTCIAKCFFFSSLFFCTCKTSASTEMPERRMATMTRTGAAHDASQAQDELSPPHTPAKIERAQASTPDSSKAAVKQQ